MAFINHSFLIFMFSKKSPAFIFLANHFLHRWKQGDPLTVTNPPNSILTNLASHCAEVMRKKSKEVAELTLRDCLQIEIEEDSRLITVQDWIRRWIVAPGLANLVFSAADGWLAYEEDGSGAQIEYASLYQEWWAEPLTKRAMIDAVMELLDVLAFDQNLLGLTYLRQDEAGYFDNPDFPMVPSAEYEKAREIFFKLDEHTNVRFRWEKVPLHPWGSFAYYEWNAQVFHDMAAFPSAFCGGTVWSQASGAEMINIEALRVAADREYQVYGAVVEEFQCATDLEDVRGPVLLVHHWERRRGEKVGLGRDCLLAAIESIGQYVVHCPTVFVDAWPRQFCPDIRNGGTSLEAAMEWMDAEQKVSMYMEDIATDARLDPDTRIFWIEAEISQLMHPNSDFEPALET